jgi:arylsulfatase A-like enzyme
VVFFHVDNLGFGELSCYSGGPFRGAITSRIDAFADEGIRLTNYCPESECTPRSGRGDRADALLELDAGFGTLPDLLGRLGVADKTIVVFAGDNGPEDVLLWRGTPGYWEGSYFAGGEGNLRTRPDGSTLDHVPTG